MSLWAVVLGSFLGGVGSYLIGYAMGWRHSQARRHGPVRAFRIAARPVRKEERSS